MERRGHNFPFHIRETPSCLITTIFCLLFIIYFIYTIWTSRASLWNDEQLVISYSLPANNQQVFEDYEMTEQIKAEETVSKLISFEQIQKDFDKNSFKFNGDDALVFLHIQKTAGTSFERFLVRKLNVSNACRCESENKKRCDCKIITDGNGQKKKNWLFSRFSTGWVDWACGLHADFTKLVAGGCVDYYFLKKEGAPKKRLYLTTFLRDPIERFISEFSHVQRGATWRRAQRFCPGRLMTCFELEEGWKEVKLDEFLDCEHNLAFNRQTRMLSDLTLIGCENISSYAVNSSNPIGLMMLESAKTNLRSFAFFGIKERMHESQLLFENIFGVRFIDSLAEWNKSKSSHITVNNEQTGRIRRGNQLDAELYAFANKLFDQRLATLGLLIRPENGEMLEKGIM